MKKGFSKFAETALCVLVIAAAVVLVAIGKADAAQAYDGWMSICDVPSDRGDIFSLTESGVLPLYEVNGAYYFRPDAAVTREYIASAAARNMPLGFLPILLTIGSWSPMKTGSLFGKKFNTSEYAIASLLKQSKVNPKQPLAFNFSLNSSGVILASLSLNSSITASASSV